MIIFGGGINNELKKIKYENIRCKYNSKKRWSED